MAYCLAYHGSPHSHQPIPSILSILSSMDSPQVWWALSKWLSQSRGKYLCCGCNNLINLCLSSRTSSLVISIAAWYTLLRISISWVVCTSRISQCLGASVSCLFGNFLGCWLGEPSIYVFNLSVFLTKHDSIPSIIRLVQCIRRYADSGQLLHLVNVSKTSY